MFRSSAAAILAFLALPAVAQVTSQTECQKDYFGVVRCQTQSNQTANPYKHLNTPNISDSFWNSYNRAAEAAARQRALKQEQEAERSRQSAANAQADAARAQEAVAARVAAEIELQKRQGREAAKLVASGNCAGAESYALSEGNLNLAKTVREYCAAAGK